MNKLTVLVILSQLLLSACSTMQNKSTQEKDTTTATKVTLPQFYPEAIEAAKSGNTKNAIKLLTQVTSSHPDFAQAHTNLGLQYLHNKDFKKAEPAFRKAIELNKKDAVAYNHLGILLREQGKFPDAKDMYLNAIKHQPDYALAHLNLGILYDIYLYELPLALQHYKQYQSITNNSDEQVAKWIIDLEHRIKSENKG